MRAALAWALYWLGDMVERWNDDDRRFTSAGFHLYQWLMRCSDTVQGSSSHGPWSAASGMEAGTVETEGLDPKDDSPTAATSGGDAKPIGGRTT